MNRCLCLVGAVSVVLFGAACGGQVSASSDAGPDTSPPAKDGAPDVITPPTDCNAMRAKIDSLSEQARTCCPFCNALQCSHVAQGLCCPISITNDTAPDLEAAIAQYKNACGPVACPATPCLKAPSNNCPPVSSGPSKCQ